MILRVSCTTELRYVCCIDGGFIVPMSGVAKFDVRAGIVLTKSLRG